MLKLGALVQFCLLLGVKRTCHFALQMSAFGCKADMTYCTANVRF